MAFIESKEFAYGNKREKIFYISFLVIIFLLSFLFLFPIYWMFKGAFQPTFMAMQVPPTFLPTHLTTDNFHKLFTRFPSFRWLLNSAVVAGSATILTLVIGSMAGYAFAKRRFPGRELIFWMLLTAMMLPKQVMLVPLYVLMNKYHLYNTYAGMFLPQVAWPFGLFLMRQFMQSIPDELIQSAKVDGASELRVFLSIIVPLSIPAFGTVGILYFVRTWNDYMWQLIMVRDPIMNTLPVAISKVARGEWSVDYGLMMAGAAYGAVPMIIIFLFFQKYFVKGLTLGAVKG
ncbi:MAG: carbohydrate ABC transporter permease [Spirochaetia bacterium]